MRELSLIVVNGRLTTYHEFKSAESLLKHVERYLKDGAVVVVVK